MRSEKISSNSQYNGMMTGGVQVRLRPTLIPLFPSNIKDEKRNEGKRGRTVKNVKRFAGEA